MKLLVATALIATLLHADCSNMPVGTEVAKSIMSKDIDNAKKFLSNYQADVEKYLNTCKDEAKQQQVTLMKLTYEDEVSYLEERLKKSAEASFDCSNVPDDTALNSAFASKDGAKIKKEYATYHKNALNYLDHCAAHEKYEMVYEASLLHDDEYANWEKSSK